MEVVPASNHLDYVRKHVGIQNSFVARCNACVHAGCICLIAAMLRTLRHLHRVASLGACAAGHPGFATASVVRHMPANKFETPEDIVGGCIAFRQRGHSYHKPELHIDACDVQARSAPSHDPCGLRGTSWIRRCQRTHSPQCRWRSRLLRQQSPMHFPQTQACGNRCAAGSFRMLRIVALTLYASRAVNDATA